MNNEENDQADQLKRIFADVEQRGEGEASDIKQQGNSNPVTPKVDVLNLPPRKEVHGIYKKRTHLRIGRPFLRFVGVLLILIIVVLGAYIYWGEELIAIIKNI